MIELRFHRELYAGKAIDEALTVFANYATYERVEEPKHWVVRITANDAARERKISRELANFALGLTIKTSPMEGAA